MIRGHFSVTWIIFIVTSHYQVFPEELFSYLGRDALDADEVVDVTRGQRSGGHVASTEAAFEADEEVFALLGVGRVQGPDELFQGSL